MVEPLDELFEDVEEAEQSPPAPTIARRAKSYSDFYDIVRAQMSKDARKKTRKRKDKSWEALALPEPPASAESPCQPPFDAYDHELLEASQQEYLYVPALPHRGGEPAWLVLLTGQTDSTTTSWR